MHRNYVYLCRLLPHSEIKSTEIYRKSNETLLICHRSSASSHFPYSRATSSNYKLNEKKKYRWRGDQCTEAQRTTMARLYDVHCTNRRRAQQFLFLMHYAWGWCFCSVKNFAWKNQPHTHWDESPRAHGVSVLRWQSWKLKGATCAASDTMHLTKQSGETLSGKKWLEEMKGKKKKRIRGIFSQLDAVNKMHEWDINIPRNWVQE